MNCIHHIPEKVKEEEEVEEEKKKMEVWIIEEGVGRAKVC